MRKVCTAAVAVLALISACQICQGGDLKLDLQTGKVRVLYVGDTVWRTWRDVTADPIFRATAVPATFGYVSEEVSRRFIRLYVPHTYEAYLAGVDLLILSDTDPAHFTTQQQAWFRDGVVEGGQGLVMAGGFEAFGGYAWGHSWKGSAVEEALPVECLTYMAWERPFLARPPDSARGHPFVTSLPWNSMPAFDGMNIVIPKEASIVLLESKSITPTGSEHPILVYSEVGKGSSVAHTPDWNPGWGANVMYYWEYYQDYIINIAYLASRIPIPQDLHLVHGVRTELASYGLQKSLVLSVLEFAEAFGGNIARLEERLYQIDPMKKEAEDLYVDQMYESALEKMAQAKARLELLASEAIKLKDNTMVWVYLVEWLAIMATCLLCGVLLWTLMVKRKLYEEVKTTKLIR